MESRKSHNKLLTVILSMVLPGSGHFYLGHSRRAFLFLLSIVILNYGLMYIYTIYVNPLLILSSLSVFFSLYFYIIYDALKIIKSKRDIVKKYNHWAITIFIFIPSLYVCLLIIKNIMPIRTFYIPAVSMENTILKNDCLVAIKKDTLQRGELSIFKYPNNPSIFYLKRCVAVGNDEVIYMNEKLLVHFHEGDKYIAGHYASDKITTINNKLWIINPYMIKNPTIQYDTNETTSFKYMTMMYNYQDNMGMTYKEDKQRNSHYFYTKVLPNTYFMMGDNREHSNDSRFWGAVDTGLLWGEPKMIYFHLPTDWSINWDRIGIKLNTIIDKNSI